MKALAQTWMSTGRAYENVESRHQVFGGSGVTDGKGGTGIIDPGGSRIGSAVVRTSNDAKTAVSRRYMVID